jgi:ABC-2 type transport system ATP-binding protein
MLEIRNLTKTFPGVTALDRVSLTVASGEFLGLLGPNGAGKSTLMNLLVGYLDPDAGEVLLNGRTVSDDRVESRMMLGLVPQSLALYDELSAEANLEIFGSFFHLPRRRLQEVISHHLHSVELYDRRKDKVKTYSGGMKRRLNLVAGILHDPDVLLCDEPTVGVDPQSRNAIFDYLTSLNREGKTIVYTTHYMEEAERLCGRIAIIDAGRIIADGTVDALLERLPVNTSIMVAKNSVTLGHRELFGRFGTLIDEDDALELQPRDGFRLSAFFAALEAGGVGYEHVQLHKPTLEALFLHLTGRRLRD